MFYADGKLSDINCLESETMAYRLFPEGSVRCFGLFFFSLSLSPVFCLFPIDFSIMKVPCMTNDFMGGAAQCFHHPGFQTERSYEVEL